VTRLRRNSAAERPIRHGVWLLLHGWLYLPAQRYCV
jgi:hypothetical protein